MSVAGGFVSPWRGGDVIAGGVGPGADLAGATRVQAAASAAIHGVSVAVTTNVAPLSSCLTTRYGVVAGGVSMTPTAGRCRRTGQRTQSGTNERAQHVRRVDDELSGAQATLQPVGGTTAGHGDLLRGWRRSATVSNR